MSNSQEVSSDGYEDGSFTLHLTAPIIAGSYNCHVRTDNLPQACRTGAITKQATRVIDGLEARLTLMEAEMNDLKSTNQQLQNAANDIITFKQQDQIFVSNLAKIKADLVTITAQNQQLERSILFQSRKYNQSVAFNVRSTSDYFYMDGSNNVKFNEAVYNQGDGFNMQTGFFEASVSGIYFLIFQSRGGNNNHQIPNSNMFVFDNALQQRNLVVNCKAFQDHDHVTCPATVHMEKGNYAYVSPEDGSKHFYSAMTTSFTGFLVHVD